jgi:hypothetical protein
MQSAYRLAANGWSGHCRESKFPRAEARATRRAKMIAAWRGWPTARGPPLRAVFFEPIANLDDPGRHRRAQPASQQRAYVDELQPFFRRGYTLFRALLLSSRKAQCVTRARNELSPLLGRHQRRAEMDYEPWLRGLVIGLSKRASNDLLEK